MELLLPAILIVLVLMGAAVGATTLSSRAKQRSLYARTPASLLPGGAPDSVLVENARKNYARALQAVRLFEHLLAKNETLPFLTQSELQQIKALVEYFYGDEK